MLGKGCPYKNGCQKYQKETDIWESAYCDNTLGGYEKCAENPSNWKNRDQLLEENRRFEDKAAKESGQFLLIMVGIIIVIICKVKGIF